MPNGTRRGHTYHRNGKTFYRGPSKIAPPKAAFAVAVLGGGLLLAVGVPQAVVGGLAVAGVVTFLAVRSPGLRRKVARKAEAWARKRRIAAGRMPAPKAPAKRTAMKAAPRPAGATPAPPYRRPGSGSKPTSDLTRPETWRTGGEPATSRQHHRLTELRIPIEPGMTKAQASKAISDRQKASA